MSKPFDLSHLDEAGRPRMVDVGGKTAGRREAEAEALVVFPEEVFARVLAGDLPKGGLRDAVRLAGIQAAKRTSEWIPLCHPLALDHVEVDLEALEEGRPGLRIRCRAVATARTGVEMEALVGAAAAALTVYDMTKALSKAIRIEQVRLLRKTGGKSGTWQAQ